MIDAAKQPVNPKENCLEIKQENAKIKSDKSEYKTYGFPRLRPADSKAVNNQRHRLQAGTAEPFSRLTNNPDGTAQKCTP
jgi:hypothetical protein